MFGSLNGCIWSLRVCNALFGFVKLIRFIERLKRTNTNFRRFVMENKQKSSLVTMNETNQIILNASSVASVKDAKKLIKMARKFILNHYKLQFSKTFQRVVQALTVLGGK